MRALQHLLPFGCSSVPFWCSWVPSWLLLGAFWVLLGGFGVPLGASWAPLGASWGLLGRSSDFSPNFYRFWLPKRTQKGAKGEPKWHQKGTQHGQKSKTKFVKKRNLSELVLDTLLGPSWAHLGSVLGLLGPQNRAVAPVALVFLKSHFL